VVINVVEHVHRIHPQSAMISQGRNLFDHYKLQIDKACSDLACKFDLYDSWGRPRNAFIIKTLMKYTCAGCIAKVFKQSCLRMDVDAIYKENHRLAVNILTERLQHHLRLNGFNIMVKDEVKGEYGRIDVLVRPISCGVLVKSRGTEIIMEVKTGKSLSYGQIFRYLLERPNAILIVWRVKMRQIITINRGIKMHLIPALAEMLIYRSARLLGEGKPSCRHNPLDEKIYIVRNPQETISDFLSALLETLPKITEMVLEHLESLREPSR